MLSNGAGRSCHSPRKQSRRIVPRVLPWQSALLLLLSCSHCIRLRRPSRTKVPHTQQGGTGNNLLMTSQSIINFWCIQPHNKIMNPGLLLPEEPGEVYEVGKDMDFHTEYWYSSDSSFSRRVWGTPAFCMEISQFLKMSLPSIWHSQWRCDWIVAKQVHPK